MEYMANFGAVVGGAVTGAAKGGAKGAAGGPVGLAVGAAVGAVVGLGVGLGVELLGWSRRRQPLVYMREIPDQVVQIQEEYEADERQQTEETDNRHKEENQQTDGEAQQGDDRSDDEHEESSQEEEESDSEEEESDSEEEESDSEEEESDSEEDESEQTDGRKKLKRSQSCRVIISTKKLPIRPGFIRIGLQNVQSLTNMADRVPRLITVRNLDVFLTTETWLKRNTARRVLTEATPEDFRFTYQVRSKNNDKRKGGGVAIQFREELQGERVLFNATRTFEYVATVLRSDDWDQPMLSINLYLPPGYNKEKFQKFLKEFKKLMEKAIEDCSSIVVTGDFNIQYDPERRSFTDEFYEVLSDYDLTQHVDDPTHEGGNTLDLVLSRNVEISDLRVDFYSRIDTDHYAIYFNAKPKPADTSEETEEDED